jgi:serralysin
LSGTNGSNRIVAGAGNDFLRGYLGNDILFGQAGRDTFIFNSTLNAATNVDRIEDYVTAEDTIWLENLIFVTLAPGTLSTAAFRANATGQAADASDRIIYDTDDGSLYYDRDGTGADFDRVRFAQLDRGLAMTAAEFIVI